jgi:hypothetical protein
VETLFQSLVQHGPVGRHERPLTHR